MLVRHSIIYGLTTVTSGLLGFLLIAVYTRLLSPADYGDYSLVIAAVSFIDATAFLWVRTSLMRQLKDEHHENDESYLSNAMLMYWGISAAAVAISLLLFAVLSFTGTPIPPFLQVIGLLASMEALTNLVIFMARIRLRHNVFFLLTVLKPGLALGLGALLVSFGMQTAGAVYGMLLSLVLCTVIGFFFTVEIRKLKLPLISSVIVMDILTFGFPLVAALSIQFAIRMTDRVLIEALINNDATGLYAAAQDLPLKILVLVVYSIHLAAYPLAVKALDKHGPEAARKQLATNFTMLIGMSFPACIGLAILAPHFASFFVGEQFRPFVMANLGYFTAISLMNCLIQYYFILPFNLARKTKLLFMPFLCALLVNLVVAWLGIKYIGVMGAALGSFAAYGFLFITVILMSRKVFPLPVPLLPTLQISMASILMGIVLWFMPTSNTVPSLALSVALGAVVYGMAVFTLNTGNIRPLAISKARHILKKVKARAHA